MQRILQIKNHILSNILSSPGSDAPKPAEKDNSLTIVDNRTGKSYKLKIVDGQLPGDELAKIKSEKNIPMALYDPGYLNTSIAYSKISHVHEGRLYYRGYPIEQLIERSNFLETAFLLIYGELPSERDLVEWKAKVNTHTYIHEDIFGMMKSFRHDSHPMSMLISMLGAHSTIYPEANPALAGDKVYDNPKMRNKQIFRLLGKMPTIAANLYLHLTGRPYCSPNNNYGYTENFLYMIDSNGEEKYKPNPKLIKAMDVLFMLNADYGMNNTNSFLRHLASSGVDIYSCMAGACGAFYGFRVGGATQTISDMLYEIGSKENIPKFIKDVKEKNKFLWGFEHRVSKTDYRHTLVKKVADDVFSVVGKDKMVVIALELEKQISEDEYFISRNIVANTDFYTGLIYGSMGFRESYMAVLLALPRMAGWLAHWAEYMEEKDKKIVRPKQNYVGAPRRDYISILDRTDKNFFLDSTQSQTSKRRTATENSV